MTDKEAIEIVEKEIFSYSMPLEEQQALGRILNLIQTQQEEIEKLKNMELKAKGGVVKVTLEGLICLETKILDLETELNKKDTLINTMQAEFERLENLEDNTDMLKEELKKKNKMIELMLEEFTDCEFELKCSDCNCECERDYDQLYACNKEHFKEKAEE